MTVLGYCWNHEGEESKLHVLFQSRCCTWTKHVLYRRHFLLWIYTSDVVAAWCSNFHHTALNSHFSPRTSQAVTRKLLVVILYCWQVGLINDVSCQVTMRPEFIGHSPDTKLRIRGSQQITEAWRVVRGWLQVCVLTHGGCRERKMEREARAELKASLVYAVTSLSSPGAPSCCCEETMSFSFSFAVCACIPRGDHAVPQGGIFDTRPRGLRCWSQLIRLRFYSTCVCVLFVWVQ